MQGDPRSIRAIVVTGIIVAIFLAVRALAIIAIVLGVTAIVVITVVAAVIIRILTIRQLARLRA